jgi:hypothetical protein
VLEPEEIKKKCLRYLWRWDFNKKKGEVEVLVMILFLLNIITIRLLPN